MNDTEKLQLIEDILSNARYYLIQAYNNMSYEEAVTHIKEELEKLGNIVIDEHQQNSERTQCNQLTQTNFGPSSFLWRENGSYYVRVGNEDITNKYESAVKALDEYVEYCKSNDFITDFVAGQEYGHCRYGNNKYAHYVHKCFERYIIGQGL